MIPFLFDLPTSVEINKPHIEYMAIFTTLNKISNTFENEDKLRTITIDDLLGTTIISSPPIKNNLLDNNQDLFTDYYDFVIKMPNLKVITQKIKIKSIDKFRPQIIN